MGKGCCIWLTGLPASGKTTIAQALGEVLKPSITLDGDVVRKWLGRDLGFTRADRRTNVIRVANLTKLLISKRGENMVIVALVSPYEDDRQRAFGIIRPVGRCIEVHLDCPVEVCEARDPKGMYAKARAGEIPHFTGVDDPYESPVAPDVYLRTDLMTVEEAVAEILGAVGWRYSHD